ncbi:uncharacterized protein [Prorops nasuta]|uniref:uncharacterized protein isoform X2 n=2 Tax=Prorops nasuta TaxID=863751 RepID=UPI0034CD5580
MQSVENNFNDNTNEENVSYVDNVFNNGIDEESLNNLEYVDNSFNRSVNGERNDPKSVWNDREIKFLIEKYAERIEKFRNPKLKNKNLWKEIELAFKDSELANIKAEALDRKLRNLKGTYKAIKNDKRKTGRGRPTWEWFDLMDKIFSPDRSVNFAGGLCSMTELINKPIDFRMHSEFENNPDDPSDSTSSNGGLCDSSNNENIDNDTSRRREVNRKLYNQRSKAIEIEKEKLGVLKNLENKIITSDKIEKKFDILIENQKQQMSHIRRRNEILEKKNELLSKLIDMQFKK